MIDVLEIEKLRSQSLTSETAAKIAELAEAISGNPEKQGGIRGLSSNRSDIFHINPLLLNIKSGFNCRNFDDVENRNHIEDLAASIATKGVLKPLMVYKENEKLWISDGECRLLATLHAIDHLGASIETVPTQIEARGINEVERVASQVNHNSGKQLTALELSDNVKRLLAFGWNGDKITKETGISQQRQYTLLDLAGVPEEVKTLIKAGEVSPSLARKTVKAKGKDAAQILKNAVVVAKANDRKQAAPRDIETPLVEAPPKKMSPQRKMSFVIETIRHLFDNADIINQDDGAVLVKFKEHERVFFGDEYDALKKSLHL
jgi:ParB/RepB/Spo0J family partition protein